MRSRRSATLNLCGLGMIFLRIVRRRIALRLCSATSAPRVPATTTTRTTADVSNGRAREKRQQDGCCGGGHLLFGMIDKGD